MLLELVTGATGAAVLVFEVDFEAGRGSKSGSSFCGVALGRGEACGWGTRRGRLDPACACAVALKMNTTLVSVRASRKHLLIILADSFTFETDFQTVPGAHSGACAPMPRQARKVRF